MDYEILGVDEEDDGTPPPRRPRGFAVGAVLALGGLIAALVAFGSPGDWSAGSAPAAAVSPSASASSDRYLGWVITDSQPTEPTESAGPPRTELSFSRICTPTTAGRTRLTVSFKVINTGSTQVRLLKAEPELPVSGYLKLVRTRAGGDCDGPAAQNASRRLLAPGESLLVTWTFRLLNSCPKPAPIGLRIRVLFLTGPAVLEFPMIADLGNVRFAACR